MRTNSTVVDQPGVHGHYPTFTMQTKHEASALGQLKSFIWQSLQLKGKHSEASSHKDDKHSPGKISPERVLRCQNNYGNMPSAMSLRIQEWQKSQNFSEHALEGNSDYVKMESPKRPHIPHSTGLNKNCDYVNFNCETPAPRRSPDYVNMDGTSDLRTSADYVNLRPDEPYAPHPLTRMNVTLHDQIWSQENPRVVCRAPQGENNLLSPPLKHINPSQFWHHPDPLDISDSVSDKSGSSGDTMIMMTSAEAKRNEANIERSTQKYEHHKGKPNDSRCDSRGAVAEDELDISLNRTEDSDNVILSGATSTDELDSILDEGYGTDSRGSITNSMSTPLSSSLSSLYSGDTDPVSRQHPKVSSASMKRQIELIPKGRIANFKKVQFTARRTKKTPENNNNSNSLQQKIMDLAIIDEETENESSTASSGSEKNVKRSPNPEDSVKTSLVNAHQRSKSERTVRWLDEETAKTPSPSSANVEMRLKSSLKQSNQRPKSYSGETVPAVTMNSPVVSTNAIRPDSRSLKSLEDSKKFSSQCNLPSHVNSSQSGAPKHGILRNGGGSSDAKHKFQRHSVAAPLESLSNSRALWKSDVDISRSSRNLEFCPSSQIYDRMRAMTRPQSGRGSDTQSDKSSLSEKSEPGVQGRPVFATSADILKLFQTKSKTDSFVRAQRHSFNSLHQKTELQTREFPQESYNNLNKDNERTQPFHLRSNSDIPPRCANDSSKSGILKNSNSVTVLKDKKIPPNKYPLCSRTAKMVPPRAKVAPPHGGQALSLSKLSTLV